MNNLLGLHGSYGYHDAAVAAFRKARAMNLGPERDAARVFARGLRDLARAEAWLEGKALHARPKSPKNLNGEHQRL